LGNTQFGSGPDGRWEFPTAAERPYSYARATWAPQGINGFVQWNSTTGAYTEVTDLDASPTFNVTKKSLTSNVATLTLEGPQGHGFTTGESVVVAGVDTTFNGTYTLTGVTTNTISYAKTAADVTESTLSAGASASTSVSISASTSATQYNVPGNVNFNPDVTVDRVIRSTED
jgi:hypothetical protein